MLKSRGTLLVICAFALLLRIAETVVFPGYEHADEIFQVLEQAHRLAFGNGIIPWEFAEGIRSYMLPGLLAGIFLAAERVWPGSYLLAARTLLSLLSLTTVFCSWEILRRLVGPRAAVIGAFLSAVWFELVYFGSKAHFEVVAGHLLLLGTYLVFPYFKELRPGRLCFGGFLLGLAFCLRIQIAPVFAVLGLFLIVINGWRRVMYAILGALVGIALAGFVDYMTLAYPFASIIAYFKVNLFEGVSDKFGRAPWHFILLNFARMWSGALIVFVWFGIEGLRKCRPMLLPLGMAAALVLAHSLIAHKEYRFVYPALPLLMIPIAAGIDEVISRSYPSNAATLTATLAGIAALSLVLGSFGTFREHFWRRYAETKAFQIIRKDPKACGVATHLVIWGEAPGYTGLHRDIPFYNTYHDADFERIRDAANYVLSRRPLEPGYVEVQEWKQDEDPLYLYHREGGCTNRSLGERLRVRTRLEETTPN
jgi:hypothetical protein